MALISIKDVKQAIRIMMQILEKLDEIYHALHDSIHENTKKLIAITKCLEKCQTSKTQKS